MKWNRCPSGADIKLFDGTIHIFIAKCGDHYETYVPLQPHGSGVLNVIGKAKTIDVAIDRVEEWLGDHCRRVLLRINR